MASRTKVREGEQYKHSFEAPDAHLLVVDDNEMNLMVVSKLLSDTKIQIDTASSGNECLRLTQYQHYDCILMDHLMPEMDGIECLHAIHSQPGGLCQTVPVIALTANAGSDNQQLYRKEGFSGYLAKPISGALLEAAVMSILPRELVQLSEEASQSEIGKDVLIFEQAKRISLMVTTDSVCDLPDSLKKNSAYTYVRITSVRNRGASWIIRNCWRMRCWPIWRKGGRDSLSLLMWRITKDFLPRD